MLMKNYLILRAADDAFPLWNKGSLPPMLGGLDSDRLIVMASDYMGLRSSQGKVERQQLKEVQRRVRRLEDALARAYADRYQRSGDSDAMNIAINRLETDLSEARSYEVKVVAWEADNQAGAKRVFELRELADIAAVRLKDMSPDDKRRVLDLLDVRSTVTAWASCEVCGGRGKVPSRPKPGGAPCPACHMSRRLPSLRVEGFVYEAMLRTAWMPGERGIGGRSPSSAAVSIPFRIDTVTLAS